MTSSKDEKRPTRSALGAPTQLGQSSRKGKRAWRKNIDIQEVEEGMESLRAEVRVIGCDLLFCLYFEWGDLVFLSSTLQKQPDDQLFVIDTKGDEKREYVD